MRNLSAQSTTFDLSRESANISVAAYVYDGAQHQFYFCSDVRMPPAPDSAGPETWSAAVGTVTISVSPECIRARDARQRRATVTISNVVLRNAAGVTVRVPGTARLTSVGINPRS